MTPFATNFAVEYFRQHEGVVNYFYQDVVGLVTIGVGFMIPSAASAADLEMVNRETNRAATAQEKSDDWANIKAQPKAMLASFYKPFTKLIMPDGAITAELTRLLDVFSGMLGRRFSQFAEFPPTAQVGLLDMVYSLGFEGLINSYPKFCAAVDRQDWGTCAAECSRQNVSPGRNADLKQLFLKAEG